MVNVRGLKIATNIFPNMETMTEIELFGMNLFSV